MVQVEVQILVFVVGLLGHVIRSVIVDSKINHFLSVIVVPTVYSKKVELCRIDFLLEISLVRIENSVAILLDFIGL